MLTNVPARLYPTAARPPPDGWLAGWLVGWSDCENLQEGPRVKDAVVTPSFFLPADNSNWAAARAYSRSAYEALKISRARRRDATLRFRCSIHFPRCQYGPIYISPGVFSVLANSPPATRARIAETNKFPLSIRPREGDARGARNRSAENRVRSKILSR